MSDHQEREAARSTCPCLASDFDIADTDDAEPALSFQCESTASQRTSETISDIRSKPSAPDFFVFELATSRSCHDTERCRCAASNAASPLRVGTSGWLLGPLATMSLSGSF